MIYGAIVFAVSAWIGLPLAATIFSSGDQITNMASMVGYGTFLVEYIMFGVAAAVVLLQFARAVDASQDPKPGPVQPRQPAERFGEVPRRLPAGPGDRAGPFHERYDVTELSLMNSQVAGIARRQNMDQ
jgi:hypothetical protein